ncbi:MAG: hypothetical protein HZA08_02675 [Nitrospirae bacterium]|nr:hypothetical protein [Nitrospirota bacterium]
MATITKLSELKQKILALYDSFIKDEIDAFTIGQVRTMLCRLKPIIDAGRLQLEILNKFFNEDVSARFNNKWDTDLLICRKINIESAFEIIIEMGFVTA